MSWPNTTPTIGNLLYELSSAGSALHSTPDPVMKPHEEAIFLDELDWNVKHAREHIQACHAVARGIEKKVSAIKTTLFKLSKCEETERSAMLDELANHLADLVY